MALSNKPNSFLVPAQYGNIYNLYYNRVSGGNIGCNITINGINVNMARNSSIDITIKTISGGDGCYLSGDLPDVFGETNAPLLSPILTQIDTFKARTLTEGGVFEADLCLQDTLIALDSIPYTPPITIYYVRPSGANYGNGDGTSYQNAWSGFGNIIWSLLYGKSLVICGTHFEQLIVQNSNVKIYGNDINEVGIIDGNDTIVSNITINNYVNVYFEAVQSYRATQDGIFIRGNATVTTKDCTFSETGNQGIQHYENAIGYHYNPLCENNVDDGISAHDNAIFYVYGGNVNNNNEGINIISNTRGYVYGTSFSGNIAQDIRVISANNTEQCILEISDSTVNIIDVSTNGKLIANNCVITNFKLGEGIVRSYAELTNCDIETFTNTNLIDITFNSCNINNLIKPASNTTNIIRLYDSYCRIQGLFNYTGIMVARRTLFSALGNTNGTLDMQGNSTTDIAYCIFKNTASGKFALTFRSSAIITRLDNCTIDNNGVGNGVFSLVAKTFNNLIIHRCVTGIQASSVVLVANNCCFNSNSTNTVSTVTINNPQYGAPTFINTAISDYRLDTGSSCINTGITAVEPLGILTADWISNIPVVVSTSQVGAWDIGAYIKI